MASKAAAELGLPLPVAINAGVHWGSTLYIGQLTGGRLEVTALGDEVNECARLQESARGETLLATKDLVERLENEAVGRLGLDLTGVQYAALTEIDSATPKAVQDADSLSVLPLSLR